jgi:hypothetical protein
MGLLPLLTSGSLLDFVSANACESSTVRSLLTNNVDGCELASPSAFS